MTIARSATTPGVLDLWCAARTTDAAPPDATVAAAP